MAGLNFNLLNQAAAFEAPKPRNFPNGVYTGVIGTIKQTEATMQDKKKIVISVPVKATGWPEDLEDEARSGLELKGKTWTKDYIVDYEKLESGNKEDLWQVDQMLRSVGVSGGTTYEELFPMATGAEVQFQLGTRKYKDKATGEDVEINEIKKITGLA
jgi:hypothetical protein